MTRFIAITSGKGGVGKTTTSVNLAIAMNELDGDVTLVDTNLTTPNVGIHLGAPVVPITLNHVLNGKAELVDSIYEHVSGAKIIPSSLSVKELKNLADVSLVPIAKDLKKISDLVILDTAAGLGAEAVTSLKIATEVIIVTNPEMPAVTDALKTAKFCEEMGKDVKGVIVNRVRGNKYEMSLTSIKEMLELPIIGVVPEDPRVQEALSKRNAVVLECPNSKSARSYRAIAANVLGVEHVEEKIGFFDKILDTLGIHR